MATITEIKAARAVAGAAYAAAAQAYLNAWAELHGYDQALCNALLRQPQPLGFAGSPEAQPHGEFLTRFIHGGLVDRAKTRAAEIVASYAP